MVAIPTLPGISNIRRQPADRIPDPAQGEQGGLSSRISPLSTGNLNQSGAVSSGVTGGLGKIELLSLGLFIFGMETLAYSELERRMDWRHASSERHGARKASQYIGPGDDMVTLNGVLVPEVAGSYAAIERLIEMADTGDHWPLLDGTGLVWGSFRILKIDQRQSNILRGGLARKTEFAVDLERADG